MRRIVSFDRSLAFPPPSRYRTLSMKALAAGISEDPCDMSCSGQLRLDCANNNSDMCERFHGFELLRPPVVLECSLCYHGHAMFEQKLDHVEKYFVSLPLNVLGKPLDLSKCIHKTLLNFISADCRTPHRRCQAMR